MPSTLVAIRFGGVSTPALAVAVPSAVMGVIVGAIGFIAGIATCSMAAGMMSVEAIAGG
eukprot:CAMPEP_0201943648 /NCGR_PEP_ID=MMETSP0903-20130614/51502_1 /ASSEMBLY_ACC=CAM_ASM_000552 /TAXON_ID=420261 /ORGANISM="Thalassiosira antarctica, Strain CCMP982" /LENGTH=58 /DNA_ID=CAMNT_0048486389 /DNA_START=424 /DNA_END=600 /DNA_ORIENTATION=+